MDRFRYENPEDGENIINVYTHNGKLGVSISDEKAMDSYNETFTCDISLPVEAAKLLRDYLVEKFPL
jgi:hypothetical protein